MRVRNGAVAAAMAICVLGLGLITSLISSEANAQQGAGESSSNSVRLPESPPASAPTAALQNGTGESITSLQQNNAAPVHWTGSYLNETEFAKSSIPNQDPDASGLNRFAIGYKVTDTKIIGAREDSLWSAATKTRPLQFHVVDPFISYADTKLAALPFDWSLSAQVRAYLPLGESTRFVTKANGSEALWMIADKSFGKLDVEFISMYQYYNNTQDYSIAYDSSNNASYLGNPDWAAYPLYAALDYNLNEKFTFSLWTALETLSNRETPVPSPNPLRTNIFYVETMFAYNMNKHVKFMASLENDAILESNNHVSMYQDKDLFYNLYLLLKL